MARYIDVRKKLAYIKYDIMGGITVFVHTLNMTLWGITVFHIFCLHTLNMYLMYDG